MSSLVSFQTVKVSVKRLMVNECSFFFKSLKFSQSKLMCAFDIEKYAICRVLENVKKSYSH